MQCGAKMMGDFVACVRRVPAEGWRPLTGVGLLSVQRLTKLGWVRISQKGSHVKLKKGRVTVIVPVHSNQDLGRGLIRSIEKQSGEKLL